MLSLVKFISVYNAQTLFVDYDVYIQYRLRVFSLFIFMSTYYTGYECFFLC